MDKEETFEDFFMSGIRIDKDFEGPVTFENCSRYFPNKTLDYCREIWDYQQRKIDRLEVIVTKLAISQDNFIVDSEMDKEVKIILNKRFKNDDDTN